MQPQKVQWLGTRCTCLHFHGFCHVVQCLQQFNVTGCRGAMGANLALPLKSAFVSRVRACTRPPPGPLGGAPPPSHGGFSCSLCRTAVRGCCCSGAATRS